MREMFKLCVGKSVVLYPTGNNVHRHRHEPLEGIVSKIGRKYFYVTYNQLDKPARFRQEDFCSDNPDDCNAGFEIFESMEECLQTLEYREKLLAIRMYFLSFSNNPSREAVKQICDLLDLSK